VNPSASGLAGDSRKAWTARRHGSSPTPRACSGNGPSANPARLPRRDPRPLAGTLPGRIWLPASTSAAATSTTPAIPGLETTARVDEPAVAHQPQGLQSGGILFFFFFHRQQGTPSPPANLHRPATPRNPLEDGSLKALSAVRVPINQASTREAVTELKLSTRGGRPAARNFYSTSDRFYWLTTGSGWTDADLRCAPSFQAKNPRVLEANSRGAARRLQNYGRRPRPSAVHIPTSPRRTYAQGKYRKKRIRGHAWGWSVSCRGAGRANRSSTRITEDSNAGLRTPAQIAE